MEQITANAEVTLGELAHGDFPDRPALRNRPYWWEDAPPETTSSEVPPPHADVVVVGAGFTGLSAALTLCKRGRSVVVLDAESPGYGASTRNGGQVGSGNQKFRVAQLIKLRGREKAEALLREGTAMLDYIACLVEEEKLDCNFVRCGRFRGAARPEHYEAMAKDLDDLNEITGVESFMVPRAEQHKEIGSDAYFGGSVLPHDASIHASLYHQGLMGRVRERGGVVIGHARVDKITRERAHFRVQTARGETLAKNVVIATNGYSKRVNPHVSRRIVPVRSAQIVTAPIAEEVIDRLMPTRRVYGNSKRVFSYYRALPDSDRIMWGGRSRYAAAEPSLAAFRHLAGDFLEVFPELRDVGVTHSWSGQIGYTFDEMPHLGVADGIHYAVGYCGTGVSRSTYFGHKIALQLLGLPQGRTAFDDLVFPSHPFHAIAPYLVPGFEAWYRLRDRFSF